MTSTSVAATVSEVDAAKALFDQILHGTDNELHVILNKVVHLQTILETTATNWTTAEALNRAQMDLYRLRNALTHAFRRRFGQQNMGLLDEVLAEALGPGPGPATAHRRGMLK